MKNLTLIAHADIEQALADTLRGLEQVSEFTFTHIESHSVQDENDSTLSARDRVVGYTPHVRVDILLQDADVDAVLQSMPGNEIAIGLGSDGKTQRYREAGAGQTSEIGALAADHREVMCLRIGKPDDTHDLASRSSARTLSYRRACTADRKP